jgi:predicted LPLAT superfamily acyltransferase
MGLYDRGVRAAIGIALIAWALLGGPVWAWFGVVPLLTAGISFCPVYTLFGLRT